MKIWIIYENGFQAIQPEGMVFDEDWVKRHRKAILNIPDNSTDFRYRHCSYLDFVVDGKIYSKRFHHGQEEG